MLELVIAETHCRLNYLFLDYHVPVVCLDLLECCSCPKFSPHTLIPVIQKIMVFFLCDHSWIFPKKTCTRFVQQSVTYIYFFDTLLLRLEIKSSCYYCVMSLLQICQGSEQTWVEDPTNQSLLYARNRIRMSLRDYSSCEFSRHGSKFHIGWGFNLKYYLHLTWVSNPSSLLMIYMGSP